MPDWCRIRSLRLGGLLVQVTLTARHHVRRRSSGRQAGHLQPHIGNHFKPPIAKGGFTQWNCPSVCLFVCACCWWQVRVLATRTTGVPNVYSPVNESYASGGGLPVAPINALHFLSELYHSHSSRALCLYVWQNRLITGQNTKTTKRARLLRCAMRYSALRTEQYNLELIRHNSSNSSLTVFPSLPFTLLFATRKAEVVGVASTGHKQTVVGLSPIVLTASRQLLWL